MTQQEIKNEIERYLRVNNVQAEQLTFTYDEAIHNGKTIFAIDHESDKFILYTFDGDIIAEPEEITMMELFPQLKAMCYCHDCDNSGTKPEWASSDPNEEPYPVSCNCDNVLFKIQW